ncbi:hypothetical protein BH23CYA1_BH23CYA1_05090 [soil metagenome]
MTILSRLVLEADKALIYKLNLLELWLLALDDQ